MTPAAEAALHAEIDAALVARGRSKRLMRLQLEDGRPVVIKPARWRGRGVMRSWLARRAARRLGQGRLSLRALRRGGQKGLEHEAARLSALHSAGWNVPRAVALGQGWLALEDVGEPLTRVIRELDPEGRSERVTDLVRDLGHFHAAGYWHGRSRLSHYTLKAGRYYRTGFEEQLEGALPLSSIQAFDLFSLLHSTLPLHGQDRREARQMGRRLMTVYFSNHPAPAVWEALIRAEARTARLVGLLNRVERWHGRDLLRVDLIRELIGDLARASTLPQATGSRAGAEGS